MRRHSIALFLYLSWSIGSISAQVESTKDLKKFYKSQAESDCLRLYQNNQSPINQIILIRHGKPDIKKEGWKNRKEAQFFVYAYDTVGIIPFEENPFCEPILPFNQAYYSAIPRASHTAVLLFEPFGLDLEGDLRFREYERKIFSFFNIKLPHGFWIGKSRILWFLGLNKKGIESFKQAKKRTKENASLLEEQAQNNGFGVLVAHGLHNRYLKKFLKKRGWKLVRNGGHDYLAINVLAKTNEK